MKKYLLLLLIVAISTAINAQLKTATLSGTLHNLKNEPMAGATIKLNETNFGTTSAADGSFRIVNIPAGKYHLLVTTIAYKPFAEEITLNAGEVKHIELQLNDNTKELSQVNITANKPAGVNPVITSGTRTPLSLIETPQSIQVIPQQLIRDQAAQTLTDLTKNMVGVINNNNYASFTMRGFSSIESTGTNNFITTDGTLGNMNYWQEAPMLYNIESVENIGGPAAALYSVGTPGGVINMVTKKPLDHDYLALSLTTGSWGLIDGAVDLGGALTNDKKLTYRLNIGANNQNSQFKYQYTNNVLVAPSLSYKFNDKTNLTVDYVRKDYHAREFEFWGGAILMKPDSTYDWKHIRNTDAFYSPADFAVTHENSLSLTFNHEFSKAFKLTFTSRYTASTLRTANFAGSFYSGTNYFTTYPDSVTNRQLTVWNDQSYNFINSLYTTESFSVGTVKNTVLTGIDYQINGGKDYYGQWTAPTISFLNPDFSNDSYSPSAYPASTSEYLQDNKNRTIQIAPYIQDLVAIGKHIKLLLAGRFETYNWLLKPNGADNYTQSNDTSTAHVFIPRAGFVYSINDNQTVYTSYCESYSPQYDNSRDNGGPFPPQIGQQEELGYKGTWFGGKLLSTIAVYNIYWKNQLAPLPTPTNPNHEVAIPGLYSRGAELTLQGHLNQWSVQGSYAYNSEIFAKNSPLGSKGDRYDNSPHSIANLWVKYTLSDQSPLKGFSFLLGGKYVSDRLGSTLNSPKFLMPAYYVFDAGINYSYKRFDFSLNGYNLTNTVYIPGWYASDFMVMPGAPINWKLGIHYTIK